MLEVSFEGNWVRGVDSELDELQCCLRLCWVAAFHAHTEARVVAGESIDCKLHHLLINWAFTQVAQPL